MEYKIIHDSIHGSIKFEGIALELLETPEMQRLSGIKQLGLGYLVFPGANHTRLEHSIGVSYVAGKMGMALGLSSEEITLLKVAGMLHDIGHSPFSHTLEYLLYEKTGMDHMEITAKIIEGKMDIVDGELEEGKRVYEILDDYSIPKNTLERMILGEVERRTDILSIHKNQAYFGDEKNYLVNIISGSLDADQIDYLLRDYAASVGGRQQLAIEAFADAMEIVPRTLAENAGHDPIDMLIELRKAHKNGQVNAGINVYEGKVTDMKELGVIEPIRVGKQAIDSATDAAIMILRIDDVIAAKGETKGKESEKGGSSEEE